MIPSFSLPVHYIAMPVTKSGDGPAEPHETAMVHHQVWDADFLTVCSCAREEQAREIVEAINAALTNTSGDDEAAIRKAGQVAIDALIDRGGFDHASDDELAEYMTRIVDACVSAARPQSAAVRDEDPGLLSIIKRMLENPATMVTDFGHPERATLTITFDTHDGAWAFMHAAGDARRALHSTQEG